MIWIVTQGPILIGLMPLRFTTPCFADAAHRHCELFPNRGITKCLIVGDELLLIEFQ